MLIFRGVRVDDLHEPYDYEAKWGIKYFGRYHVTILKKFNFYSILSFMGPYAEV